MTVVGGRRPQLPAASVGLVGLVAFACRLGPVLHGGGLRGMAGYDDGVYFAAAHAIVAGQVPYRDFVLLHPPGLPLLLTPFALLGHVVGDANGWAGARLFMMALGAASAMVAVLIGRRFGRVAAIGGGLLYAVWVPAINGETSTLLECMPNLLLLTALAVLGSPRLRSGRSQRGQSGQVACPLVAGAALGLGTTIKIWGLAPLAVVLVWQLIEDGRRRSAVVLGGAVAAVVAVCVVPFALAPARMTQLVVSDQLQRAYTKATLLDRLADFTPVHRLAPHAGFPLLVGLVAVVLMVGLGAAAFAVRQRPARVFVALLLVQGAVLCVSPPYFTHYGAYLAPAAVLTAAVGAQGLVDRVGPSPRWRPLTVGGLVALLLAAAVPVVTRPYFTPYDTARISAVLAGRHCVAADSPGALALAGVLTRDLERGCPTRIDVSGVTYTDAHLVGPDGMTVPRSRNPLWQKYLMTYLLSADAAITTRSAADGLTRADVAALSRKGILYRGHGVTVYG